MIEYLWKAAFVFYSQTSTQAEAWESKRLQLILEGKSSSVVPGMGRSATLLKFTPQERKLVDTCARFLLNNPKYLKYDHYLKAALPIATGVIEGACRHLIKNRMDITGAKWTMRGGEAVLPLGSLYISGDWDEYWQFHLQQEHKPNHLALYSSGIPLIKQVIKAKLVVLLALHIFQYLCKFHSLSY
ncbi:hypothetical protein RintRC_4307 [Richelia intracellularis]|nr:hypothetical protein RintRC_4307 [Richelia intracellularis]